MKRHKGCSLKEIGFVNWENRRENNMRYDNNRFTLKFFILSFLVIIFFFSLVMSVNADDEKIYGGVATAQEFQEICQGYMTDAFNLSDSDMMYLIEASDEPGPASFLADYSELKDSIGDFVEFSDFNISEEGGVVTAVQTCVFAGGNYDFSFIYDTVSEVPVTSLKKRIDTNREQLNMKQIFGTEDFPIEFIILLGVILAIWIIFFIVWYSLREKK